MAVASRSSSGGHWSTACDALRDFAQAQLGGSGDELVSLRLHLLGTVTGAAGLC